MWFSAQQIAKTFHLRSVPTGTEVALKLTGLLVDGSEFAGKHALGFIDRGTCKEISFIPEIAAKECNDCKACFPLCPTSYLQAAFVRVESLTFPREGK